MEILDRLKISSLPVRYKKDLDDIDALIIPGGESTALTKLIESQSLYEALSKFIDNKYDMKTFDLKISDGTVANATETFHADIGIKDGLITAIGKNLGKAKKVINADGKLVLPGGIEAHCHIEQESSSGIMTADDYYSGSVSAAFGGNTCFIPFAAQHRGQKLQNVLDSMVDPLFILV